MSEKIRILYYALWFAHPLLQLGVALLMLRAGLQRKFRFFFGYLMLQLFSFGVVCYARFYDAYRLYFFLYWIANAVSVALGFAVIHEVFVDVFRFFHTLRDLGTVLFKWAGVVMLLVAGVVSVSANTAEMSPLMQAIITSQRCVRIIQVGMILFLLFFARYLGISRRAHSFGIALGFGFFAVIELTLIASWVGQHLANPWISIVNMSAYNVCLLVWVVYVAVKRPVQDSQASLLRPQRWEQSLSDLHHPVPADSLIPMFENLVDRALSRTPPELDRPVPAARSAAAGVGNQGLPPTGVPSKT